MKIEMVVPQLAPPSLPRLALEYVAPSDYIRIIK